MTSSGTETTPTPVTSDADTGDDGYAHYARKDEIARAAVLGGTITALCGHRFQPVRDPQRFPVCPRCKELGRHAVGLGLAPRGVRGLGDQASR